MRDLQVCNYNRSSLHISVTSIISNSLYDKFEAEKQLWLLFNNLIIYFKHHSADSETAMQLKKNEQEEDYSWHTIFVHAQIS